MPTYKSRGIVLHTIKYGERALIAHLYTGHAGRQGYIIQGIRRTRGHGSKGALFQPMFILQFEGDSTQRSELHRMREVRNLYPLVSTPFDARKSTISMFMAEVLYRMVREVEPNEAFFGFLTDSVVTLDSLKSGVANFHLWFLVRLSEYLGFYPGGEYHTGDWFDIKAGEFTAEVPPHRFAIAPAEAALLARLMDLPAAELGSVELSRGQRVAFMEGVLDFFGYHFDAISGVRSLSILREVF